VSAVGAARSASAASTVIESTVVESAVTESEPSVADTDSSTDSSTDARTPRIRVVHGNPTAEELAAVVTVLAAVSVATGQSRSDNDQPSGAVRGGWTARERGVRAPLRTGPGGWRASAFPPVQ
jgi:hypothetical protein